MLNPEGREVPEEGVKGINQEDIRGDINPTPLVVGTLQDHTMADLPDKAPFPILLRHLQVLHLTDLSLSPQLLPGALDSLHPMQEGSVQGAEEAISHLEEEDQAGAPLHFLEALTLIQAGQVMSLLPGALQEPMQLKYSIQSTLKL